MHYFSSKGLWRVVNAFQWLPILTDLRSMSLWGRDERCWCVLEVTCQQVEIQRGHQTESRMLVGEEEISLNCWSKRCVVCFFCALL